VARKRGPVAAGEQIDTGRSVALALAGAEAIDEGEVSRAEAWLRQLGVRRSVTGPRKRPKRGWTALTETETKVALLVADGRSNPEIAARMFLSRRTIQSHVSSILAKFGLRSRVEIAIHAYRREPV